MFTIVPVTAPGVGIHQDTVRLSLCNLGTYSPVWKGEKERKNDVLLIALRDTSRMLRYSIKVGKGRFHLYPIL